MSYRPKVKSDSTGTITDLALDAETVKGVDVIAELRKIPTESTVSGWGFTKNTGTVTKVNNTSPDSNGNVSLNFLKSGDYEARIPYLTSNATIALTSDIPVTKYTQSTVNLYTLADGRYINSTENDITMYYHPLHTCNKKWKPGDILYIKFHRFYLLTQGINSLCIVFGAANDIEDFAWCNSAMDLATIPQVHESMKEFGNESTPVYLSRDTNYGPFRFKKCKLYGGGTGIVKLNGYDTLGKTYDAIYAPETAGTSGQFLKSNGNGAPTWVNLATVATSGSYNDLSNKPTIPTKSSWNYDDMYVKYTAAQTLTDAQKSQARTNIGAGTSSLTIGTTASTAAAGNHTHSTTLATDSGTATVTMVPNETYKLSTGGTNVIFKTPSDAYKIVETLRKGSEADTAVGYYKIATINHVTWNFCDFCMLVKNSYSGTAYSTIFNCSCSDSNTKLQNFNLEIISGTDISNKLAYLYTYDSSNNLIKVEVFIHATRFEHPMCYIINAKPGKQLVIPTQDEFNKATPDQPDGTTMTGYAGYADNRSLLHHDLGVTLENTTTDKGWKMFNPTYNGFLLKSVRFNDNSPAWGVGDYGSGIVFGGGDTKGVISLSWRLAQIKFAGGNSGNGGPVWWIGLTGTSGKTYDLDELNAIPKRVTGSLSYPANTGGLATLFNLINNHRDIRLWTYKYVSGAKYREIRNLLYFTSHGEVAGDLYSVTLSYISPDGTLTKMTSGTIYYEYFE